MNRSATYHHLRNLPQPPQIFREDKILSKLPVAIIQSWYQRQGYVKFMADLIQKELQTFWSPDEELVLKSKLLKMCLEERSLLEDVLQNYIKWEHHACSALRDAESLLNILDVNLSYDIVFKIGDQITKMESIMKAEYSLRFDSLVIPKLQETCAILQWCFIALNFHAVDPTLNEVLTLLEDAEKHHVTYASRPFWRSLVDGMNWLKKALEILGPCNDNKRFDLSDVKETLRQYKMIKISFSLIVDRLLDAVKRHNVWVEEVKSFFNCSSGDRSWSLLLQLESTIRQLGFETIESFIWNREDCSIALHSVTHEFRFSLLLSICYNFKYVYNILFLLFEVINFICVM